MKKATKVKCKCETQQFIKIDLEKCKIEQIFMTTSFNHVNIDLNHQYGISATET